MSGLYRQPAPQAAPKKENASYWEKITGNPGFPIVLNIAFFAAGVAFIQSPLIESLVPQL